MEKQEKKRQWEGYEGVRIFTLKRCQVNGRTTIRKNRGNEEEEDNRTDIGEEENCDNSDESFKTLLIRFQEAECEEKAV